jgi:hypothetical protein
MAIGAVMSTSATISIGLDADSRDVFQRVRDDFNLSVIVQSAGKCAIGEMEPSPRALIRGDRDFRDFAPVGQFVTDDTLRCHFWRYTFHFTSPELLPIRAGQL